MAQHVCPVLAECIRRLRMGSGLQARQAAPLVGVAEDQLTKIERGERAVRLDTLRALARLPDVPKELLERMEIAVLYPERVTAITEDQC